MSSLRKKLALAAVSAGVSAVALEFGFRALQRQRFRRTVSEYSSELYAPSPGHTYVYTLRPGVQRENTIEGAPDASWSYAIGPDAMRVAGTSDPEALRVVAIGDSYTFGWGVDDDDSYPAQLERTLAEALPDRPIDVVNAGIPGHNTSQTAALTKERLETLDPDVLVLGFVMNDAEPTRELPQDPDRRYALAWSWTWEDLILRLGLADGPFRSRLQRHRGYPQHFAEGAPERILCERAFDDLVALASGRGIPLIVAILPDTTKTDAADYPYRLIHDTVHDWCTARGVTCVDLLNTLDGATNEELCVPVDGHPNAVALGRFAAAIAVPIQAAIE